MPQLLEKKEEETKKEQYKAEGEEKLVLEHLEKRIPVLKKTKKSILNGLDYEAIMKAADEEYSPRSLSEKETEGASKVVLVQDEVTGKRGSRIVPIADMQETAWRSDVSEPTLFVKINTALSILIDQNPEAVFKAIIEKYKAGTTVAEAIYKRSWALASSKEQLKLFVFDLAKYGWAIGRTYPRLVQRKKSVLVELDVDDPSKNKYEEKTITEFNDIYREKLDPYRTWIDDMANLTDPWSENDWCFEKDYDEDGFKEEFGDYANARFITFGQPSADESDENVAKNKETKERSDITTLTFYESKRKDLYAIYCKKDGVVLYYSPLPNDDGMLSNWWTYWNERDARTPYGIGLYEIIKNNKVMYDRLNNMDLDQLVLSIYSMLFYSGSNQLTGDGTMVISPGLIKQKLPGTTVEQVKIEYSGEGREGAINQNERIDEVSGITPTLQGEVEGKTLGEVLHAKDAALKRLNVPLSNIAHGFLEKDAHLTLSWANQLYTLPEVQEFTNVEDLEAFIEECGIEPSNTTYDAESGVLTADFPRVLDLSLDEDRDGALVESPESRFFKVGQDLPAKAINWKGKITVNPQSIIAPSQELDRQRKIELFNLVSPVVTAIATVLAQNQIKVAIAMAKPVVQVLETQNEKPKNWLPDEIVMLLNMTPEQIQAAEQQLAKATETAVAEEQPLFVKDGEAPAEGMEQDPTQTAPGAIPRGIKPVAPRNQVTNPGRDSLEAIGSKSIQK